MRKRPQPPCIRDHTLARKVNELVDEMAVLTEALKNERIRRSRGEASARVAAKKPRWVPAPPAPDDRATVPMPPPPEALEIPAEPGERRDSGP